MTFTELEYVLMLTCAVLMWRNTSMKLWAKSQEHRANKYADFLTAVYEGKGKVIKDDEGRYAFKETNQ